MLRNPTNWRLAGLCALACTNMPAIAQTNIIDEITVTADYRERSLVDVPLSISVLDAETISSTSIQHFEELVRQVPNMNWSGDGHRARYFQLRGVGELAQYQGAPNPSVGFIVDDIDFSGIGSIATLYDIERIEVLRGPQGTRYGANALAGLVYVRSTEADGNRNGNLQVSVADDDAWGIGAATGGQLGSNAAFRVSGQYYEANGFRDNPYLGRDDTNGRQETTLRGKLRWSAWENWDFRLAAMYADINDGYDAFAIDNSLTVLSNRPGRDAQESVGASFRGDWDGAESFVLTSITAYANSDIDFSFDADWGNDDAWAPVLYDYVSLNDRRRTTISQEFRLTSTDGGRVFGDSTDWLVGFYANRLSEDLDTWNQGEYFDPGFNFADSLDDQLSSQFDATNIALFGQLDFAISDNGVLAAGLRVENRSTDYDDSSGLVVGPSETMLGGELSYTHTFGERTSMFASLSKGYKAGGFNLGLVPDGEREFDQEALWNTEVGIRSSSEDGRLAFNAAVFYSVRQDQQVEISVQLDPNDPASFVFYTGNDDDGKTVGIEADVSWLPLDSLELFASVGLLDAELSTGRDQAHAPRYTYAIGGEYRHDSGFFARLDVTGKDEFYFDFSHDQKSESYSLTNMRLGYAANRWTAQLFARNLFDETYAVRGFFFGNEPPNFPPTLYIRQGDPRQIGLRFDWSFD